MLEKGQIGNPFGAFVPWIWLELNSDNYLWYRAAWTLSIYQLLTHQPSLTYLSFPFLCITSSLGRCVRFATIHIHYESLQLRIEPYYWLSLSLSSAFETATRMVYTCFYCALHLGLLPLKPFKYFSFHLNLNSIENDCDVVWAMVWLYGCPQATVLNGLAVCLAHGHKRKIR